MMACAVEPYKIHVALETVSLLLPHTSRVSASGKQPICTGWDTEGSAPGDLTPGLTRSLGALSDPREASFLTIDCIVSPAKEPCNETGWDAKGGAPGNLDLGLARELSALPELSDRSLEGRQSTSAEYFCYCSRCRLEGQVRTTLAVEKRALTGPRAVLAAWRQALASGRPLELLYAATSW